MYCTKAGERKDKTVLPSRFEESLRTFLFLSELLVLETPETARDRIPLYEEIEDEEDDDEEEDEEEDDEDTPPPITLKKTPEALAQEFRMHHARFARLMRAMGQFHIPKAAEK